MDNWVLNIPYNLWPLYQKNNSPIVFRFFESKSQVIVLSSSNKPQLELNLEECKISNTPILRRKGGGGTVVLGSGCLIFTFAFYAKDLFSNSKYFEMINGLWMESLQPYVKDKLYQNGISDICVNDKKIAGTSLFRKKHLLVYQGSLLVDVDLQKINQLLSHPTKEPDYRLGRSHLNFLTTLKLLGCNLSAEELALKCQNYFNLNAEMVFKNEFHLFK